MYQRLMKRMTWMKADCHCDMEINKHIIFQGSCETRALNLVAFTVREAQNRCLCRAFPFVFCGLPNIFKQESGYFLQYLQFKFLAGSGCAKSQILVRQQFFKHNFSCLCHIGSSDKTQMNLFDHLHCCCQLYLAWYNRFGVYSGCAVSNLDVMFFKY